MPPNRDSGYGADWQRRGVGSGERITKLEKHYIEQYSCLRL